MIKETIDSLSSLLTNFKLENVEAVLPLLENVGILGEMQAEFNNLYNSLKEYHQITSDNHYKKSLQNINLQIEYNDSLAWITKG